MTYYVEVKSASKPTTNVREITKEEPNEDAFSHANSTNKIKMTTYIPMRVLGNPRNS